jgi:hypothetical protein
MCVARRRHAAEWRRTRAAEAAASLTCACGSVTLTFREAALAPGGAAIYSG